MAVFSVGHGTRSLDELIAILHTAGVERLVDVRSFPGSKRNPQFAREALEHDLPDRGIGYDFRGNRLGGRRGPSKTGISRHPAWRVKGFRNYADFMDTEEFAAAIAELEIEVHSGVRLCLMCAETLWWRCHRRLISDALVMRGVEVIHLLDLDESMEHQLHEAARPDDRNLPVYDSGFTGHLPL
jgi:uncharacterized protein (DUF488 family)